MRRNAAVIAAKVVGGLSRGFRVGGGTALPGLVAERIDPQIISGLASHLGLGSVLITGTNGKTTTARLLRGIAQAAGFKPVANRAGSNMMRGIASALAESARWTGAVATPQRRIGIFEVDEATLPLAVDATRPRVILFTNLFRDQLDRYGEVETVAQIWRETADKLPDSTTLILNADDPSVACLAQSAHGPTVFYGMRDRSAAVETLEHAADARWCSSCGTELSYEAVFYGHIGVWGCPGCANERPQLDVACEQLEAAASGSTTLSISLPNAQIQARLPFSGLYNAYNALAAAAAAQALGLAPAAIEMALNAVTPAFGRQERLTIGGRDVQILLAKNPAGLNQVLHTIISNGSQTNIALFLNDGIADGRDISWIWDVDFELLDGVTHSATASGTRAWDMALRLKYAGLEPILHIEPDEALALREALRRVPEGETLYVIPTYTAMLKVRELLARRAGRRAFWELA